jgi:beta-N-acetylhexosaminidase
MTAHRIVVMGVSGSGKSTVGERLADALQVPFVDGDDLHPDANKAKMAGGTPLEDADRWPWLALVGEAMAQSPDGIVVACSALKRTYRDAIRAKAPDALFVYLEGSVELLRERIGNRIGHFMPAALLDSQLATLEVPAADERAITTDVAAALDETISSLVARITASPA